MRTPPHLPARPRREHGDHVRRHPYGLHDLPARGLHDVPAQTGPRGLHDLPAQAVPRSTLDFADPAPPPGADLYVEQRLLDIREMSNQAIGSIDDLLQHTA
ncbi:hypothetical protein [Nonomuraea candida]|uniref:hypothetical protein n=1 Tax=Nonomuraea candida TaxID=359159 RepID=UPI0005BBD50F|nr:hypothetical protein [Nonomuraea candida]